MGRLFRLCLFVYTFLVVQIWCCSVSWRFADALYPCGYFIAVFQPCWKSLCYTPLLWFTELRCRSTPRNLTYNLLHHVQPNGPWPFASNSFEHPARHRPAGCSYQRRRGMLVRVWRKVSFPRHVRTLPLWKKTTRKWALRLQRVRVRRRVTAMSSDIVVTNSVHFICDSSLLVLHLTC